MIKDTRIQLLIKDTRIQLLIKDTHFTPRKMDKMLSLVLLQVMAALSKPVLVSEVIYLFLSSIYKQDEKYTSINRVRNIHL